MATTIIIVVIFVIAIIRIVVVVVDYFYVKVFFHILKVNLKNLYIIPRRTYCIFVD